MTLQGKLLTRSNPKHHVPISYVRRKSILQVMSIFQLKQSLIDPVDLHGVINVKFSQQGKAICLTYLTRLDQALIAWGVITAAIFLIAQFCLIDWYIQAIIWSALSCIAIAISGRLTWFWVTRRNQRWISYGWSLLVIIGLFLTDYSVFTGWSVVLRHLCALWLGLSAVGYTVTGVGMQAQALILMGFLHLCAIPCVILLPVYQFLLTGVVMSISLLCLALFHWDHC